MQNLTAHYNILFNAREIIRLKQESYSNSFIDNYNELLNVYPDTSKQSGTVDKDLETAIAKANTIINLKEQSHYLGDAYLVLGKSYYLEGNYFNAVEYFSYVTRSFAQNIDLTREALVWKARCLMYLNQLPQAKMALDSAFSNIKPKKKPPADIYAVNLQYDINVQDYEGAEKMAGEAVKLCRDEGQRLRWTFILGQLQELNKKTKEAYSSYTTVIRSNSSFELEFNASLNRIRIEDNKNGAKISRTTKLLALLKNPDNNEFKDQIYFQVAGIKLAENDIDAALKYYKLSVRNSLKNQNQKGLSYLKIAEIYFQNKADYLTSKKYYDSTLTTLPINYPGYSVIQKKGNNLQLLAGQLQIIAREDTLQALARMDEKTRLAVIDKMVNDKLLQLQAADDNAAANNTANTTAYANAAVQSNAGGGSTFYFYNANAVSQGYNDFKQKWGNRKLEDNWRRSNRSGSDVTNNPIGNNAANNADPLLNPGQSGKNKLTAGNYRQELLRGLPLSPPSLAQSNILIYNAYVDLGNIYRDIMNDPKDAIAAYEIAIKKIPANPNNPAVYYSLFRLYSDLDKQKADYYKNLILKDYPATVYAKVITDPDYIKNSEAQNTGLTLAYNGVFELFEQKQYKDVIKMVPEVLKQYPGNKYSAQLLYLQTIAAGHNEKLPPFQDSLLNILKKYPNDKLIDPLINQHLAYINANQTALTALDVVLADNDPKEVPFTINPEFKEKTNFRKAVLPYQPDEAIDVKIKENKAVILTKPATVAAASNTTTTFQPKTVRVNNASSIFSMSDSTHYFFVINVSTGTTNLSSSRFGIGQFDRANYAGYGIRHQLMAVGADNQLIYVGTFKSYNGAKKYEDGIISLLPEIMKVPKDKYSFFIITQENLNKLDDKKTLDSYIDYYQQHY